MALSICRYEVLRETERRHLIVDLSIELFRVWAAQHPDTTLSVINASEEVAYMVNRGLPPGSRNGDGCRDCELLQSDAPK